MLRKKLLSAGALLLAMVMCLSVTVFAAGDKIEFTDVKETDYFCPAVQWGVESGITNGVGGGRFDPQGEVTRAQVVTFLWRMAGTPEPSSKETFTDVEAGSWYETAVQWAVENDITNGTGSGKFSPALTCDRAMCLTLLYRMEDSPLDEAAAAEPVEISEDSSIEMFGTYLIQQTIEMFRGPEVTTDVEEGSYYELAVIWGSMGGIITEENTGKMDEGVLMFRPKDPCVRAEMISFLYQTKLLQDKANEPETYEIDGVTIAIPQEYSDLVSRTVNAIPDGEDGILITVSELKSREAAEALGEDPDETGAGELFSIERVSEARAKQITADDVGGAVVFAKDGNGKYYVFNSPTDVRYVRGTPEDMAANQDQWTKLNEWAQKNVRDDILKYSEGLTPVDLSGNAA